MGEELDRTLAIVKPDAVARGLEGPIVRRIVDEGLTIVGLRRGVVDSRVWSRFYDEHAGRPFFHDLVEFMASGVVVVAVLEWGHRAPGLGRDVAVCTWRRAIGATDPRAAAIGTLREMYGDKSGTAIYRNVAHGSDSPPAARREAAFFFHPNDLDGVVRDRPIVAAASLKEQEKKIDELMGRIRREYESARAAAAAPASDPSHLVVARDPTASAITWPTDEELDAQEREPSR